jgi:hypothetical protein
MLSISDGGERKPLWVSNNIVTFVVLCEPDGDG